jgi:hypothetical protein
MDQSAVKISKELIVLELFLRQNMLEYLIHENWKTRRKKKRRRTRRRRRNSDAIHNSDVLSQEFNTSNYLRTLS